MIAQDNTHNTVGGRGGGRGGVWEGMQHFSLLVPGLRTVGGGRLRGTQTVKNIHSEGNVV